MSMTAGFRMAARRGRGVFREVLAAFRSRSYRDAFGEVERYCQFVGFPRSGHTIVGALLNAHPDMVIAHEADALQRVFNRARRTGLYTALVEADRRFEALGYEWEGYSYAVPGQWQGRWQRLRVIGDKQGGLTARHLRNHPYLLNDLRRVVNVPLRFVIVTRNPFDNITRIARRDGLSLSDAIARYGRFAEGTQVAVDLLDEREVFVLRYEDFVADPEMGLMTLAGFLEVEPVSDWVANSAKHVFASPPRARTEADWSASSRDVTEALVARHSFLTGYSFDS
jgi:hypothetical protein